ncbi:MAG TPA: DUF6458 family protein [Sporichthya sp.]|nr:DUF6458 family protein [Sporichthya sp.]
MGIGVSIFLIAIGAVLALAVDDTINGIDVATLGWILVAVGVLGILLDLLLLAPRRRAGGRGGMVEERRVYDDGGPSI